MVTSLLHGVGEAHGLVYDRVEAYGHQSCLWCRERLMMVSSLEYGIGEVLGRWSGIWLSGRSGFFLWPTVEGKCITDCDIKIEN